jgi:hypothetical protein
VKKLKAWLIEWKHRVGKENRKMRKKNGDIYFIVLTVLM